MLGYNPHTEYASAYRHPLGYANYGVSEKAHDSIPEAVMESLEGVPPSDNYQTQLSREATKEVRKSGRSMVAEMMPGPNPRYYLPDHVFYERLNFD